MPTAMSTMTVWYRYVKWVWATRLASSTAGGMAHARPSQSATANQSRHQNGSTSASCWRSSSSACDPIEASRARVASMAPTAPVGQNTRRATAHTPATHPALMSPTPTAAPPAG